MQRQKKKNYFLGIIINLFQGFIIFLIKTFLRWGIQNLYLNVFIFLPARMEFEKKIFFLNLNNF